MPSPMQSNQGYPEKMADSRAGASKFCRMSLEPLPKARSKGALWTPGMGSKGVRRDPLPIRRRDNRSINRGNTLPWTGTHQEHLYLCVYNDTFLLKKCSDLKDSGKSMHHFTNLAQGSERTKHLSCFSCTNSE